MTFFFFDTYDKSSFGFYGQVMMQTMRSALQIKRFFVRSRWGEMWFLWSQAIDSDRGAWASLKWGGLLHLKVDQTQKYSGDDNKMSRRHVTISVCPAFVVLLHFFFPSHLFFLSPHESHAWVRPLYWGATFFRNGELLYGLFQDYIFTSNTILTFQSWVLADTNFNLKLMRYGLYIISLLIL